MNKARMVDVGSKAKTHRVAVASGRVSVSPDLYRLIVEGIVEKGDAIEVARVAAIAASKRTSDLLPLCHPIALTRVEVEAEAVPPDSIVFRARVEARDRTGVEMEALHAVSTACLCLYDLCKKHDRAMVIESIRLEEKMGGRSGRYRRDRHKKAR